MLRKVLTVSVLAGLLGTNGGALAVPTLGAPTAPPMAYNPAAAPPKYVKINGIMKLNPEYKIFIESSTKQPATSVAAPQLALPVVSTMEDHEKMSQASVAAGGKEIALSESTNATIEMMQDPEICAKVGLSSDAMVDGLGTVLTKYEIPMGLANKLMVLSEFDQLEFIIDDSGSMISDSDTKNLQGQTNTRWQEAHGRLKDMMEVLAFIPTQEIIVRFLNRPTIIQLVRRGETPQVFKANAFQQLDAAFSVLPAGRTPGKERLADSFIRGKDRKIARYFFGDGTPDGGLEAQHAIAEMVKNRLNPQDNPVTFISCTNEDDQVEWMKTVEEDAPFCSELDDFDDEAAEVVKDQGRALPFTKGFHLIAQLVAAMNPDDLDAMDESCPFTKFTLESLLGVTLEEKEFRHYFDEFKLAQSSRAAVTPADAFKKSFAWDLHYSELLRAAVAKDIAAVRDFKAHLKILSKS